MDAAAPTRIDPFESLNAEQRLAVGHGLGEQGDDLRPLLIIAGAGSGKTNTLAYRVANLILHDFGAPSVRLSVAKIGMMKNTRRVGVRIERKKA